MLVLALLGAASLCGAVLAVGLEAAAPAPASIGSPPDDLSDARRIGIPSASGANLQGWWLPATRSGNGAVVLVHGVRSNRLSEIARARVLHDHGFAVLLFDLQAHGESTGRHITFGHLEALDVMAAVDFVRRMAPDERIGVIGQSLGGAAALLGPAPLRVDALVLESVYPDIDRALSNRLKTRLGGIAGRMLAPVLTPLFESLLPPLIGVTPADLRPVDHIAEVKAPILIASGTDDRYTPIAEARELFDHAAEPKIFWPVDGAGHVDLERFDPQRYWATVLPFLTRCLRQAS